MEEEDDQLRRQKFSKTKYQNKIQTKRKDDKFTHKSSKNKNKNKNKYKNKKKEFTSCSGTRQAHVMKMYSIAFA